MSFLKKKSFGQHFLHEKGVIEKIAALVDSANTILEIGPGEGALTRLLQDQATESGAQLVLAEADQELFAYLEKEFPEARLVPGDAAHIRVQEYVKEPWVCVGNLPYNAAAAIMSHVIRENPRPIQCIFMIQREQADRVCASPGDMSMLSLAVQLYGEVSRKFHVPPGAFSPPPKIDSTVIEIIPYSDANTELNEKILHFAQFGFRHRRKQLFRMLVQAGYSEATLGEAFEWLNMKRDIRPQNLSIEQWKNIYALMHKTPTN